MIGTELHARWRILSELGRGGMGEVYLAEDIVTGRKEALKIMKAHLASDAHFVSRFRREARAINRLRHPNIVAVYDFGQLPDERFFLSMEYAEGTSVYQRLKRDDHFEVPRALWVIGQLVYAVHHAHSRGVVHRDLKPDNLLLCGEEETLKVLDFGVAKIVASDHSDSAVLSSANLVYGTPKYMSPERAGGVGNDPRTDLYSIGCIAYELVVGGPPFTGTPNEVIKAHMQQPPEVPSRWRPTLGIPPELDAVILRCLAKRVDERYQSAAELYAALQQVPGYPTPKSPPRRKFVPQAPPVSAEPDAYGNLRGALREAAEALLDQGADDTRLVTGIAYLRDHEQTLVGLEATQDALEHEAAAIRETAGGREQALRFALAELRFAPHDADHAIDIDARVADLERRLVTAVQNGERLRQLENSITFIVEQRAETLDHLKSAYDTLERVVDELLPA
ncbi:MAG TPA: serine/threonine-protein kinase, partial [Kofleriaceae bacterium]|nr:serine/threonine-protein kinase [Kofleriaceae bacterium]